jgi:Tol biopolymer transport system component
MGNFELWTINLDGSGLERITYSDGFDGFPMFSPDGKKLVWASNRNAKAPHKFTIPRDESQADCNPRNRRRTLNCHPWQVRPASD